MALYAISDLHLAFGLNKPMDIFGSNWTNHDKKIKENWMRKISESDTVLISGDISWSMNLDSGMEDIMWIHELPGKKVLIKGNHDYWWNSVKKLNDLFDDMFFIQNSYYSYEDYAICGTRGWMCPGNDKFTEHDDKIYKREKIRLELSITSAIKDGFSKFIVMLHYPPTNDKFEESLFTETLEKYGVEKVIYGHLHGPFNYKVLNKEFNGIQYFLTSSDYLNFDPIKILE